MHSRIYLIGFMGSGKTSHGKKIARMMGYDFIDMDDWIEEQEGISIAEIFERSGEHYFREKEHEVLKELGKKEKVVISTGGGAPCNNNSIELMNSNGLTIYLKLSPAALLSRLKEAHTERPLLAGKSEEEMRLTIEKLLQEREPYYNRAGMVIDGLESVTERIVNAIQRR